MDGQENKMNLLFLTLRGNILGDSIRDTALVNKYIRSYSKKYNLKKSEIKIYYPCGSLIYNLFKYDKYLKPILIKDLDILNKNDVSKIRKLIAILKSYKIIKKKLKNKKINQTIYSGFNSKIRLFLAKKISKYIKSKFLQDSFINALGYNCNFNIDTKKYSIDNYLLKNKNKKGK